MKLAIITASKAVFLGSNPSWLASIEKYIVKESMSDRKNKLERYVAAILEPTYKYSRPTIGSGSTPVEKGDVKNPYFCIECKDWNTKSFSIKDEVWKKIKIEAADESKDAVYIMENSKGNRLAVMDLEDWKNLVLELIELRQEKENASIILS